ncbi:MAG: hypothetical protein K1060chlam1_01420 [Candidatus Anoxychlamydiales bacterium]|nr:hypothetical protein [Candidatus Anoxychlamydiales bacterium]
MSVQRVSGQSFSNTSPFDLDENITNPHLLDLIVSLGWAQRDLTSSELEALASKDFSTHGLRNALALKTSDLFKRLVTFKQTHSESNDLHSILSEEIDVETKIEKIINFLDRLPEEHQEECLKSLLMTQDEHGNTPVHLTHAFADLKEISLEMIKRIANPKTIIDIFKLTNVFGENFVYLALSYAQDVDLKLLERITDDADLIDLLKVNSSFGMKNTPLHRLFYNGYNQEVALGLIRRIPDTKTLVELLMLKDEDENTVLNMVLVQGDEVIISEILDRLSDTDLIKLVEIENRCGSTALNWAEKPSIFLKIFNRISDDNKLVGFLNKENRYGASIANLVFKAWETTTTNLKDPIVQAILKRYNVAITYANSKKKLIKITLKDLDSSTGKLVVNYE